MGILPLAIETGRYTNISVNQIVFYCKDKVEDEFYFVCHCKLYEKELHHLYSVLKQKLENFDTLSDEDKFIIVHLSYCIIMSLL